MEYDPLLIFSLGLALTVSGLVFMLMYYGWRGTEGAEPADAQATLRITFAAATVALMAAIFVEGMAMYHWGEGESGKDIFDACTTVVPPIFALVLGYYFGSTK